MTLTRLRFRATDRHGDVSAVLRRPDDARWLLVLGHGAGAGMQHHFMDALAEALGRHLVATFRYQFPYMEAGQKRPDPQPVLTATVRAAVDTATTAAGDLPLLAGGKSLGGRMTSLAATVRGLPEVRGIVFVGFPLHPAGRPDTERAEHLEHVDVPMLFLQGTRDALADLELMQGVCRGLGAVADLRLIDGADHSFAVLKRSGRDPEEVLDQIAAAVANWASARDEHATTREAPSRS